MARAARPAFNGCVLTIKILFGSQMVWDRSVLAALPANSVGATG